MAASKTDISAKTCGLSRKLFDFFPKENRLKPARLRSPQNFALWVLSTNGGPEGTLVQEGEPQAGVARRLDKRATRAGTRPTQRPRHQEHGGQRAGPHARRRRAPRHFRVPELG